MIRNLLGLIYIVIGILVASDHHYLRHVNDIGSVISVVLAVLLWPLVLLGVNLHIR